MLTIAFLGDIMLGRRAGDMLSENGPEYPWGDTLRELKKADLRIANLECLISEKGEPWPGKFYNFRAPLSAIDSLKLAGIDYLSLANNHAMDFGFDAMKDMHKRLERAGIKHSGSGRNLEDAMGPALLEAGGMKVSIVSVTDNMPAWSATADSPGVFNVPLWSRHLPSKFLNSVLRWPKTISLLSSALSKAKSSSDLAVLSAHTGPNNVEKPSTILQRFAYEAMGHADVFHGHSAHTFQGISVKRGKPILFDSGDFVDDYPHNSIYRNEWGFIYFMDFENGKLQMMRLVPIEISECQANLAKGENAKKIIARMERLSKEMGTEMKIQDNKLIFPQQ